MQGGFAQLESLLHLVAAILLAEVDHQLLHIPGSHRLQANQSSLEVVVQLADELKSKKKVEDFGTVHESKPTVQIKIFKQ